MSSTHTEKQSCTRADSLLIICTSEVIPSLVERSVITCERGTLFSLHMEEKHVAVALFEDAERPAATHIHHTYTST